MHGEGNKVRQVPLWSETARAPCKPERLRCTSYQELFTAPLPVEAGEARFTPSAQAMVALLTSGAGMPA